MDIKDFIEQVPVKVNAHLDEEECLKVARKVFELQSDLQKKLDDAIFTLEYYANPTVNNWNYHRINQTDLTLHAKECLRRLKK